jgi:hypothetical protein
MEMLTHYRMGTGTTVANSFRSPSWDKFHPHHFSRSGRLFPGDPPLQMQLCEWLRHSHTARKILLLNTLWRDKKYFTREGVFSVHTSHFGAWGDPHASRERGYEVSFSVWTVTLGTLSWAPSCYLTDRLISRTPFCRKYLKMCLWLCGRCCGFNKVELHRSTRGCPTLAECSTRHRGPNAWPLPLPNLVPMDIALWGTPEGARLCSPSKRYWRSGG